MKRYATLRLFFHYKKMDEQDTQFKGVLTFKLLFPFFIVGFLPPLGVFPPIFPLFVFIYCTQYFVVITPKGCSSLSFFLSTLFSFLWLNLSSTEVLFQQKKNYTPAWGKSRFYFDLWNIFGNEFCIDSGGFCKFFVFGMVNDILGDRLVRRQETTSIPSYTFKMSNTNIVGFYKLFLQKICIGATNCCKFTRNNGNKLTYTNKVKKCLLHS